MSVRQKYQRVPREAPARVGAKSVQRGGYADDLRQVARTAASEVKGVYEDDLLTADQLHRRQRLSKANDKLRTMRNNTAYKRPTKNGGYEPLQGIPEDKARDLTFDSSVGSIYGCCGYFDLCGDRDLVSLSAQGSDPLMDWIGWSPSDVCMVKRYFVTYVRAEDGDPSDGFTGDPCSDAPSTEWGVCDFMLRDFAFLHQAGPVRNITERGMRLCVTQPLYRIDGTQIADDEEYDAWRATQVIMQTNRRMVINGNSATPGQYDGLERLVKDGYVDSAGRRCQMMDSLVVDWATNSLDGGGGITINGNPLASTWNFIDVLIAAVRRIKERIAMAPLLAAQRLAVGDMILLVPGFLADCILDANTCWSVCPGVQFQEANLNIPEARKFRDNLNGGLFGDGRIFVDGYEIPLLRYNWGLIKGPSNGDVYLLTGSVGSVKLIDGHYLDMRNAQDSNPGYFSTDGGRLLNYSTLDNACKKQTTVFRPRIQAWAPWASARFQNVQCTTVLGPMSGDPLATSFYPQTSFSAVRC